MIDCIFTENTEFEQINAISPGPLTDMHSIRGIFFCFLFYFYLFIICFNVTLSLLCAGISQFWMKWNCLTDSETVEKGGRWVLACLVSVTIEFKLIFKKCSMIRKYRNWFCVSVMAVGRSLVTSLSLVSACYETIDFLHMILLCRFFFRHCCRHHHHREPNKLTWFFVCCFSIVRKKKMKKKKYVEEKLLKPHLLTEMRVWASIYYRDHSIPFHSTLCVFAWIH